MDYKKKYLKYKKKYNYLQNNLVGGSVPRELPPTQSWFYMPILLRPFNDIQIDFPQEFENESLEIKAVFQSYSLLECNDVLRHYYSTNGVDLNNRRSLSTINSITFDDKPQYVHLTQTSQEYILNHCGIAFILDQLIQSLILKYKDYKFNFYKKDNIFENIRDIITNEDKIVKIHYINKYNTLLYNQSNIKPPNIYENMKYEIYDNTDAIIREHTDDSNRIVIIVFGYWGDKFNMFFTLNKNHSGLIIYFNDSENKWYDNMGAYINIINKYANQYQKYCFFGTSMGGFGSIYASLFFPGKECICIAFSPQVISTGLMKNVLVHREHESDSTFMKVNPLSWTKNLINLFNTREYNTKIYTIISKSECDDNTEWMLMDQFHIGMIINYPNVSTIIYEHKTHSLLVHIDVSSIYNIINNYFDRLYNNQEDGNQILFNEIRVRHS